VRDLLLGEPLLDVDVLLSAGLESVSERLAERLGGRRSLHERFLTATVESDLVRIDLAQARAERYARPGALPTVRPATVAQDLLRRDFSVNALALPLAESWGGALLDPAGGVEDLAKRQLRVLHDASFRDDPTRILRAVRYAARLRFSIEPHSRMLARQALRGGALDSVSGDRLRQEVERLLEEPETARAISAARELGVWSALAVGWQPGARREFGRLKRSGERPPWRGADDPELRRACALRLLLLGAPSRVRRRVAERLALRGRAASQLDDDLVQLGRLRRALARPLSPGRLDARLAGSSEAALLLTWCAGPDSAAKQVARYAGTLRDQAGPIDGRQARALGLSGPAVGALLRTARRRALDGESVDDAWLRRWLARNG
jgi:tRNA nucleotidyltransferase (CCA-adding enzyme)